MASQDNDSGANDVKKRERDGSLKDHLKEAGESLKDTGIADKSTGTGVMKGLGTLASLGITLVAATFVGLIIGIYLDKYFGTKPWLTIIFLIFGIIAGFRNMYTLAKKYGLWSD